ncbi:MAG: S26 family signal peptidase, partial [Clostridiales bacterium]|nr:S26 family signal peptidase [Clostridiales bacterium]
AGDTVKCEEGVVLVKYAGKDEYTPLSEEYAYGTTGNFSAVLVGEGEIFFLGDNRENSRDARMAGCRPLSAVTGVVPDWSIKIRGLSTFWEGIRANINSWFE